MRLFSFSLLLLFLLIASERPFPAPPAKARQRALIIAIGDYPRTGGWGKLSSARDAQLLEAALREQGFKDITVLLDEEATRQGIEAAFAKLTRKTGAGDIVYLHFSGHGQQIWDQDDPKFPNRRKDETDGYDEALVPYDARDEFRAGIYEGEHHLVDDELRLLLHELRQKIGPGGQLVFSVDACYSGSISRAESLLPVRGTSKRFVPESIAAERTAPMAENAFSEAFSVSDGAPLSDLIVLSAARADQPNFETVDPSGKGVGSLSYAISRNLMKPYAQPLSFSNFFRHVEAEMAKVAPFQSPQLEGDADKSLFGDAVLPVRGFPVLSFGDERHCTVQGGELGGLYPGTAIRLERSDGTGKPRNGEVSASQIARSVIELTEPLPDANPADWVATVETQRIAFSPVNIATDVQDETALRKIQARVAQQNRITLSEEQAQLIITQTGPGAPLRLSDLQETTLGEYSAAEGWGEAVDRLFQRIQAYSRAHYFRQFSAQGEGTQGKMEILPVPVRLEQRGQQFIVQSRREEQLRTNREVQPMEIGTPFIFKVRNRSESPLYLSIIGIDAADEVFLLLPDARTPPAELVVAADTTVYFSRPEHIFQVAEPAGKQLFLAFASYQPVDLHPVFRYVKSGQVGLFRGESTPQEEVLQNLLFGSARSGGLPGTEFIISSTTIDIPPPAER